MPASGRLKAASGDYSRVCKQTVPAAVAFSLPSAFPPSEPSRESPCGVKNKAHVAETYLSLSYPLPPTAAPPIRTLTENDVRRLLVLLAPKVHEKTFSFSLLFSGEKQQKPPKSFPLFRKVPKNFFPCFSVAKSSKSHPTDSDTGVRKAVSGVGRLRGFASKPSPPLSLSALRPLFRHRNQVGTRHAG